MVSEGLWQPRKSNKTASMEVFCMERHFQGSSKDQCHKVKDYLFNNTTLCDKYKEVNDAASQSVTMILGRNNRFE